MSFHEVYFMTQEKYRFDLSDGFGKDDIFAIFAGIWNFIAFLLKLVLFPYVWILRMLSRSVRFIKTRESSDKLLTEDEQLFMESTPTFFILVGFFVGILVAVVVAVFGSDAVSNFLEDLSIDSLVENLGDILGLFLEIILWIIGLDTGTGEDKIERWGIVDFFRGIFEILTGVFTSDPALLFIGIGLVGVAIAVVWIVISETGIVSRAISIIVKTVSFIITTPGNIYERTYRVYIGFNKRLSAIVIGTDRIQNNQKSFHKKILVYSLGLGIWTFLGGLFVLASQEFNGDTTLQISFIMFVLIVFGLGVGIIEMFIIVRFLDIVSRGKYSEAKAS